MRKIAVMAVVAVVAVVVMAAALLLTGEPAEAGPAPTTHVFVVHGGNFNGQTSLTDGGTVFTVCFAGGEFLRAEFGQDHRDEGIELPSGQPVEVTVSGGYPSGCDDQPGIEKVVTPIGDEFALVITGRGDMLGIPIATCTASGTGTVQVIHAANVLILNVHTSPPPAVLGAVRYSGELSAAVDPATSEVTVVPYGGPDEPIATGALNEPNSVGEILNVVYIVGGDPDTDPEGNVETTPVMLLIQGFDVEPCAPIPAPAPPAAAPATVEPTFTG